MDIHHFIINVRFENEAWYLKAARYTKFFDALKSKQGITYITAEACKDGTTDLSFFVAAISEEEAENSVITLITDLQKLYPGICYFP
jgi:hypothetical protein